MRLRAVAVFAGVVALAGAASAQVRIVQTNSGNTNNVHLIDPATHRIVGEITNVPINHGAAASPDGKWLYFSSEAEQTLHVVDAKTLQTTKKIPLSGRPNNISIGRDGRRVYVGIVSAPGAVDVIDAASLEKVKSIPTKGAMMGVRRARHVCPCGCTRTSVSRPWTLVYCLAPERTSLHNGWLLSGCVCWRCACCFAMSASAGLTAGDCARAMLAASRAATPNAQVARITRSNMRRLRQRMRLYSFWL